MTNSELWTEACISSLWSGTSAEPHGGAKNELPCLFFPPLPTTSSKIQAKIKRSAVCARVDLRIKKKKKKKKTRKIQTHRRRDALTRQSSRRAAIDHSADGLIIPHLKPTVCVKAPVTTPRSCCFPPPSSLLPSSPPTNPPTNWKTCCLHTEAELPCKPQPACNNYTRSFPVASAGDRTPPTRTPPNLRRILQIPTPSALLSRTHPVT